MARINTKLNLNKTPHLVENNSLIFAKNIRIDIDGNIHKDYGMRNVIDIDKLNHALVESMQYDDDNNKTKDILYLDEHFKIIHVISDTTVFYLLLASEHYTMILKYDEHNEIKLNELTDDDEILSYILNNRIKCSWTYNGGTLEGTIINNLYGEQILTIAEACEDKLIPIKHININQSKLTDDESTYTQTPNVPISNIYYMSSFDYTIPNGIYQFYIRYRIRNGYYTNWFLASTELFAGNHNTEDTNFGTVRYTDVNKDCNYSFVLKIEHCIPENCKHFKDYQIGFTLSHDNAIYARAWKHFNFTQNIISFDYETYDALEIEPTDLFNVTYDLYNVKNIANFKNKLYVSNYVETNFNPDLQKYANNVLVDIKTTTNKNNAENTYQGYECVFGKTGSGITADLLKTYPFVEALNIDGQTINIGAHDTESIVSRAVSPIAEKIKEYTIDTSVIEAGYIENEYCGINVKCQCYEKVNLQPYALSKAKPIVDKYYKEYIQKHPDHTIESTRIVTASFEKPDHMLFPENYDEYGIFRFVNENIPRNNVLAEIYAGKSNIATQLSNYKTALNMDGMLCYYNRELRPPYRNHKVVTNSSNDYEYSIYYTPILFILYEIRYTNANGERISLSVPFDETQDEIKIGELYINSKRATIKETSDTQTNNNNINEALENASNRTTLIPYQNYKFFIHYIKANGEHTNGYNCGDKITAPYSANANSIIYPSFSNIVIPEGYVACFFTILHSDNITATVTPYEQILTEKQDNGAGKTYVLNASCIDLNLGLIPYKNRITIRGSGSANANYYASGDSRTNRYFGADGVIVPEDAYMGLGYYVTNYSTQQNIDANLVKCTPYITSNYFDDYKNCNLLGYSCVVALLDRTKTCEYYTDGSNTVFKKENITTGTENTNLDFHDLGVYTDSKYKVQDFTICSSSSVVIYSNYNLNFLSLSENIKTVFKTYYDRKSTDSTDTDESKIHQILWKLLSSLTLSNMYTLNPMYKLYNRKYYQTYDSDTVTVYENTIRSSRLQGDESKTNIFIFDAEDYYNVPTNRGPITNLISVGDAILVHTTDSMYKFSGSNSLSSSSGEIQTNESEVFDTGVHEIFGSDHGYAGLQHKKDHIMTENGYIFFDRDANIVYVYAGNNQIVKLSDSVESLFNHEKINHIAFANDYYNNRFLMCIYFENNDITTLSFNLNENIKSFVSLHDYKFNYTFNTKCNCYFINDDKTNLYVIDKNTYATYGELELKDELYIQKYDDEASRKYCSIIDVICNTNIDIIKTLDTINWSSSNIVKTFGKIDTNSINSVLLAEPIKLKKPYKYLRIYTDTCSTDLFEFDGTANDAKLSDNSSYRKPRYNQGKWAFNYFRNILNANNLFKYLGNPVDINPKYTDGATPVTKIIDGEEVTKRAQYRSDENSLIEGKYFVVRFVFDENDFSLESLNCIYKNKIN